MEMQKLNLNIEEVDEPKVDEFEVNEPKVDKPEVDKPELTEHANHGTGAGGANTTYFGKQFEEKTNNQMRLLSNGYSKYNLAKTNNKNANNFYLSNTFEDKTITFVLQYGLRRYMKYKYNIQLFRCPDEAYIIEYTTGEKVIKILEKKEQNVNGSVETKLWASPSLKREYELVLGSDFKVIYGLCINSYLQNLLGSNSKKYTILKQILHENQIDILFGDDDNYFEIIQQWIFN